MKITNGEEKSFSIKSDFLKTLNKIIDNSHAIAQAETMLAVGLLARTMV